MPVSMNNTTLTFNDATTQTTAPTISSATAVASTGISVTAITTTDAATHTITNTGVTSIVAGTSISISGATGAVTVTNGGVTSLNGQTGAITDTNVNSIGGYVVAAVLGAFTGLNYNTTIAGSSLVICNQGGATATRFPYQFTNFDATNPSWSGTYRALANSRNSNSGCCGVVSLQANFLVRIS